MKKPIIIIFCLLYTFASYAQGTWRTGSITLTDSTTIAGEINDKEWTKNPEEVEFRSADMAVKTYTCSDVISFSTDRPIKYETWTITYDGDNQQLRWLPYGKTTDKPLTARVFMRVIVDAPTGLLYYRGNEERIHFFSRSNGVVEELLNRKYRTPENNNSIGINQRFKQQILLLAGECGSLKGKITQLSYEENQIEKVILEINRCHGNEVEAIVQLENLQRKTETGVVVNGFLSAENYSWFKSKWDAWNFGGGVYYEIYNKRRPKRSSIYNEFTYKHVSQMGEQYPNLEKAIENDRVRMAHAIRFSFPGKQEGRWYFDAGIFYGLRLNTTIDGQTSNAYDDFGNTEFEVGPYGAFGKTFAMSEKVKINLAFRYEYVSMLFGSFTFNDAQQLGFTFGVSLF